MYHLNVSIDEFGLDDALFAQVSPEIWEKFIYSHIDYVFQSLDEMGKFISAIKNYIFENVKIDCERVNLASELKIVDGVYQLHFYTDWHDFYEYDYFCLEEERANFYSINRR